MSCDVFCVCMALSGRIMSNRVGLFSTLRQALHQSVDVTIWSNLSILIETPNINWYHVLYIDIWYMIPGLCFIHNFFVKTSWARWPEASLTSRTGEGSSGGRRAPGKWTCFFSLKVQDLLMWQMFQKKFHIVWKLDMFFSMMLYMYIYTYVTVIYLYISRISRLNLRMLVFTVSLGFQVWGWWNFQCWPCSDWKQMISIRFAWTGDSFNRKVLPPDWLVGHWWF